VYKRQVPTLEDKTKIAEQFADWFEMAVYGKYAKPESMLSISQNMTLDVAKLSDAVNRYTSLSLLALNVVQGTANVLIGEAMEAIDAVAGEYVNPKLLTQATAQYTKWLPGMMGDVGMRRPYHIGSLLSERFRILHQDPTDVDFQRRTKVGQLMKLGTSFFVQRAGEHWMQNRFLYAMLLKKKAYDSKGNDIGPMLKQYYAKNGKLMIRDKVDLVKSEWTEKDQNLFMRRTLGILSRMHGEYSDLGRIALQRYALGRMAYMFRKFVVPGMKRRWAKRHYIQRLDQFAEGNYRTTARFVKNLGQDLVTLKWALLSENWVELNEHERANVRRTITEVAFVIGVYILSNFLWSLRGEGDEDDDLLAFWSYQAFRLRAELLFFTAPQEAMSILRSPMASMSIVENLGRLLGQCFEPLEQYERGPWKGDYKIKRALINMVPMYKQYYKVRDIEEQVNWFKR